jgi:hypothetical protein
MKRLFIISIAIISMFLTACGDITSTSDSKITEEVIKEKAFAQKLSSEELETYKRAPEKEIGETRSYNRNLPKTRKVNKKEADYCYSASSENAYYSRYTDISTLPYLDVYVDENDGMYFFDLSGNLLIYGVSSEKRKQEYYAYNPEDNKSTDTVEKNISSIKITEEEALEKAQQFCKELTLDLDKFSCELLSTENSSYNPCSYTFLFEYNVSKLIKIDISVEVFYSGEISSYNAKTDYNFFNISDEQEQKMFNKLEEYVQANFQFTEYECKLAYVRKINNDYAIEFSVEFNNNGGMYCETITLKLD